LTLVLAALLPLTAIYLTIFDWTLRRYFGMLPWFVAFGIVIMLCMSIAEASSAARPTSTTRYIAAVILGSAIDAAIGLVLWQPLLQARDMPPNSITARRASEGLPPPSQAATAALTTGINVLFFSLLVVLTHSRLERVALVTRALSEAEIAREELQRSAAMAHLEAARVAIDPPAVIARLEEIERTYDHDIGAAEAMLDEVIARLRASIPQLREARARALP
jgi:hypothetical protein